MTEPRRVQRTITISAETARALGRVGGVGALGGLADSYLKSDGVATIQKHDILYLCKKTQLFTRGSDVNKPDLLPTDPIGVWFDFWACQRPLTHRWGSGQVFDRICKHPRLGTPDVAFGKTDGIPSGVFAVDKNNGYDWVGLPFEDNKFAFGYWDPPYDSYYKKEGQEIWRTVRRIAILHIGIWPRAWLKNAKREAMIAVTMGPMKQIRCLQVFRKSISRPSPPEPVLEANP